MNRSLCAVLLITLTLPLLHANTRTDRAATPARPAQNAVLLTAGGTGLYLSLNYERKFHSTRLLGWNLHLAGQAGIGTSPFLFANEFSIPVSAVALWGGTRHFLQAGFGLTLYTLDQYDYPADRNYTELRGLLVPSLGYRFGNDKIIAALLFSPVINPRTGPPAYWFSLSLGWGF